MLIFANRALQEANKYICKPCCSAAFVSAPMTSQEDIDEELRLVTEAQAEMDELKAKVKTLEAELRDARDVIRDTEAARRRDAQRASSEPPTLRSTP